MQGSITVPFSELFADTVAIHGEVWSYCYYVIEKKMAEWEFKFWMKSIAR